MPPLLPKRIDIRRLADLAQVLEGNIPLVQLPRLVSLINSPESREVMVKLSFSVRQDGWVLVQGRIVTEVVLQCQRCLEDMGVPLESRVSLGAVSSEEEIARLPDALEPLVITDEPTVLADLIEDELLLVMPLVPLHEQCGIPLAFDEASVTETEAKRDESTNPFAILQDLAGNLSKAD